MPISQINQNSLATGVPSATSITTGTLPSAQLPAGTVLQVVYASGLNSAGISTTSTSAVASGITVSITLKRASSAIRLDWVCSMGYAAAALVVPIYANGVSISGAYSGGYIGTTYYAPITSTIYISPGTTSTQVYAVYFYSGGGTAYLVHPGAAYSLTATEISV
jgi:hypothetical protein